MDANLHYFPHVIVHVHHHYKMLFKNYRYKKQFDIFLKQQHR